MVRFTMVYALYAKCTEKQRLSISYGVEQVYGSWLVVRETRGAPVWLRCGNTSANKVGKRLDHIEHYFM